MPEIHGHAFYGATASHSFNAGELRALEIAIAGELNINAYQVMATDVFYHQHAGTRGQPVSFQGTIQAHVTILVEPKDNANTRAVKNGKPTVHQWKHAHDSDDKLAASATGLLHDLASLTRCDAATVKVSASDAALRVWHAY